MGILSRPIVDPSRSGTYWTRNRKLDVSGLTASAVRIETPDRENMRRIIQPWQALALAYYDAIGEIHYAGEFYARSMQNVRFYVGERDENDEIVESENEDAKALLARVQDPGGGRRMMTSRWGQLAFITGEALLMWSAETEAEEERWEIVSNDELRPNGSGGYFRMRAPALGVQNVRATPDEAWQPVPDTSIVYRMWKPHPRFSALADSPMRGVLDLCKELLTLTQAVNAQAISHAARAGLLLVPEEIDFPAVAGQDENADIDPFEQDLNGALMAAIADPSSAAALAPMVVRAKAEYLHPDSFRHMDLADLKDKYPEENLRSEIIRRIALGLDMPPEELLGKADVNHWTSWEIDENAWKHVEPIAWSFADNLSRVYLRPTARKEKIDGWERLCIGVDEGAAVVKPDRGTSANEVYDRGGINLEALRAAHDFGDDQKMDDEEYQTWLAIKLNTAQELPEKWQTPEQKQAVQAKSDAAAALQNGVPQSGAAVKGKPATKPETAGDVQDAAQTASLERMLGAAEMAVMRAREKAGARAKGAAQGCDSCKQEIDGVPLDAVAATLGHDVLTDLGLADPMSLVAGGADGFVAAAMRWGWPSKQAQALGEMVEMHAARSLYDREPAPLTDGFAGHVRRGNVE